MTRPSRIVTNLALALALSVSLAATTRTASAQSQTRRLKAAIPFAFSADKIPMPAGNYVVEIREHDVLSFTNVTTGKTELMIARQDGYTANKGGSRLTFRSEAGQTYLTQLWVEGQDLHSNLIAHPKPQRELAKLAPAATTVEVAMN